ncbi:hypothetical protein [Rhodohalobacter sp. SW132]|uniref:hypothetical protein n=1 Tax=Rhodohalobacter sp. SW132 TaxID=2293433 RepID=UPI0011C02D85|nr:hypothetical protein [Rhodohalobacter sp. SW132]
MIATHTNQYILHKQHFSAYRQEGDPLEAFYPLSKNGEIVSAPLLVVDRFPFYFPIETDRLELPFPMPFTRSSLVSFSRDGRFYTNWTDDFLIRIYDSEGEFEEVWYESVTKSELDMNIFELSRFRERSLAQYEMPETWPAVHTMELDDEDRLWVATITDSDFHLSVAGYQSGGTASGPV